MNGSQTKMTKSFPKRLKEFNTHPHGERTRCAEQARCGGGRGSDLNLTDEVSPLATSCLGDVDRGRSKASVRGGGGGGAHAGERSLLRELQLPAACATRTDHPCLLHHSTQPGRGGTRHTQAPCLWVFSF